MSTGRHVISTTLTTIGGFIPLLLGGGTFWPPLAIVIAGGVGGATILATIYIPSIYVLVRRWVEPESKSLVDSSAANANETCSTQSEITDEQPFRVPRPGTSLELA